MIKVYIDLGTTNLKYLAEYNEKVISEVILENKNIYFDNQNYIIADNLFNYILSIADNLNSKYKKDVKLIFSSAMHTLILLDKNFNQIQKGYSLLDNSNFEIIESDCKKNRKINALVNNNFLPLYKLKSINLDNTFSFTTCKSYILMKLIGQNILEVSDASGTGLLNFKSLKWDEQLIEYSGTKKIAFPKILKEYTDFEITRNSYKLIINLGISDGAAAAIGSGAISGKLSLSIGTTLGLRTILNKNDQVYSNNDYLFPIYNNKFIYGISSQNGGNNINFVSNYLNLNSNDLNLINWNQILDDNTNYQFFRERFDYSNKKINLDYSFSKETLKSIFNNLIIKTNQYKAEIEKNINLKTTIIATGGVFKNNFIHSQFKLFFKNDIIISEAENLSVTGLKIIESLKGFV